MKLRQTLSNGLFSV